jgi:phage terminase small subunit
MKEKLTDLQKKFCDFYIQTGNATDSYIKAGYKTKGDGARVNASRLLTNANVQEYIKERNSELESTRIADMKEVKQFWTNMLRDKQIEPKDRLKASEYIAKTNGAFLDKVELNGKLGVTIVDDLDG